MGWKGKGAVTPQHRRGNTDAEDANALACLGGCSQQGECFNGKCFCNAGWGGDDCGTALTCNGGCSQHGICQYGICFCDPGWEGPDCENLVQCPNGCSGHGTCSHAKCFCDDGWRGADCSLVGVVADTGAVALWKVLLLQIPMATVGALLGWGVKHVADSRQRRKMREILQQEAQRPFISGLPPN